VTFQATQPAAPALAMSLDEHHGFLSVTSISVQMGV
jgi:hypothetical protein